jgi:hypothetical protein
MRTIVISLSGLISKLASDELNFDSLQPDTLYIFDCMEGIMQRDSSYWSHEELGLSENAVNELHFRLLKVVEQATTDGRVMWRTSTNCTTTQRWDNFRGLLERNGLHIPRLQEDEVFDLMDHFNMREARVFLGRHFATSVIVLP